MLPKIGITTINTKNPTSGALLSTNGWTYNDAVTKGGGVPFLLPSVTNEELLDAMTEACDGFIFSGGPASDLCHLPADEPFPRSSRG